MMKNGQIKVKLLFVMTALFSALYLATYVVKFPVDHLCISGLLRYLDIRTESIGLLSSVANVK